MSVTKIEEAQGSIWQPDDDHPSGNGGYQVVAKATVSWSDEREMTLDISRSDGETGCTLYLSPDQAKTLVIVLAAALADAP